MKAHDAGGMSGGDGAKPRTNLETGVETTTLYTYGRFEVNENLSIFAQFAASRVETEFQTSVAITPASTAILTCDGRLSDHAGCARMG